MRGKINLRSVQGLKVGQIIWDERLAGFGARRLPSGRIVYAVKYRAGKTARARQRWVTIGAHGAPWTPDTAREKAKRLFGNVAEAQDPAATREADKEAKTVAEVGELYLTDHIEPRRKGSTAKVYRDILERLVKPRLGQLRAREVQPNDIDGFHGDLKGTPTQANRATRFLSAMFNWAIRQRYRPAGNNPVKGVELYPEKARDRFLSDAELSRLATAIEAEKDPYIRGAVRLLLFTGARLGEILTLKWKHVDLAHACLRLPDSKTGARVIHLNAPALELLNTLPRLDGNPYVIVGAKDKAHLVNLEKPWRRIRARAGLDDVRMHDLRHSFASVAATGGMSLPMIGKLLGHSRAETTHRYAHLAADPVKAAGEAIGARIAAAMSGKTAEVVPMAKRQAGR